MSETEATKSRLLVIFETEEDTYHLQHKLETLETENLKIIYSTDWPKFIDRLKDRIKDE